MRIRRRKQRGSALLVTMIIISALLAGAAVLVSMQLAQTASTDLERNGVAALYCAEAGIMAAKPVVAANYSSWDNNMCTASAIAAGTCTEPSWLTSGFNHDLDADGSADVVIYLEDDWDEQPPDSDDPNTDNNNQVFIIAKCLKYPNNPREVSELIKYTPTSKCYSSQEGGCNGRGNAN